MVLDGGCCSQGALQTELLLRSNLSHAGYRIRSRASLCWEHEQDYLSYQGPNISEAARNWSHNRKHTGGPDYIILLTAWGVAQPIASRRAKNKESRSLSLKETARSPSKLKKTTSLQRLLVLLDGPGLS